jgi:TRAP-type C4-dicarboxylate transport system permease small subunit
MALEETRLRVRMPERWFEVISTALGLLLAGLMAWAGTTQVQMRDDIHTLKDVLPAMAQRLDRVEARVDKLDDEARERVR